MTATKEEILQHINGGRPKEARAAIIAALKETGMHRALACENIGCVPGSFIRWTKVLGMREELAELEAEAIKDGWHHGNTGGRPRVELDRADVLAAIEKGKGRVADIAEILGLSELTMRKMLSSSAPFTKALERAQTKYREHFSAIRSSTMKAVWKDRAAGKKTTRRKRSAA